uniref:Defensin n=1 Tax=Calomera littoralis TaxID=285225 RepID=A0A173FZJ6_CALLO|nr:defensin [Calomera littoralis]
MYKTTLAVLLLAAICAALPLDVTEDGLAERANRHRRVTCDLLSFSAKGVSVNHAACAAHCLAMLKGYRGGRCIDGVCHCRR